MTAEEILRGAKLVAVVGLSPKEDRDSNSVARYLQSAGYRVIPINPKEEEILGERSYASIAELPEAPDIVDVFRRPEHCPEIARQAAGVGAKAVWLQLGIESDEAGRIAEEAGMGFVQNRCIRTVHRTMGAA